MKEGICGAPYPGSLFSSSKTTSSFTFVKNTQATGQVLEDRHESDCQKRFAWCTLHVLWTHSTTRAMDQISLSFFFIRSFPPHTPLSPPSILLSWRSNWKCPHVLLINVLVSLEDDGQPVMKAGLERCHIGYVLPGLNSPTEIPPRAFLIRAKGVKATNSESL